MTNRVFLLVLVLSPAFFSGCVCSVHPILNEADLTTELDLSGRWELDMPPDTRGKSSDSPLSDSPHSNAKRSDAKKAYSFVAEKYAEGLESDYDVIWNGKEFHGQVGKLGEEYFLQLRRSELGPEIAPLLHAVPVYAIARIELSKDGALNLFIIDELKAPEILGDARLGYLRYTPSDLVEYFVLTESTSSMQKRFEEAPKRIFAKQIRFVRSKGGKASTNVELEKPR